MTRYSRLNSPFLLGFDQMERMLDRAAKTSQDGYPPYNVEQLDVDRGDALRITLAVAGFSLDELTVTVEQNQLLIGGKQPDDKSKNYLHRGIAARQFQRSFLLAEGMEVMGAELKNGLLSIDVVRPEPERSVREVKIKGSGKSDVEQLDV